MHGGGTSADPNQQVQNSSPKASKGPVAWAVAGAVLSTLISLASLALSVMGYIRDTQDSIRDTQDSIRDARDKDFQAAILYEVSGEIATEMPARVVTTDTGVLVNSIFWNAENPYARFGAVEVWVKLLVTNTGVRPFSVESIDVNIARMTYSDTYILSDPYPQFYGGLFLMQGRPTDVPMLVDPGQQTRVFAKVAWPVAPEVAETLFKDPLLQGESLSKAVSNIPSRHSQHRLTRADQVIEMLHSESDSKSELDELALRISVKMAGQTHTNYRLLSFGDIGLLNGTTFVNTDYDVPNRNPFKTE